ncbi:MAG: urease accessory protein UreF [Microcystis wesenbergii Mw_MB_S_20031200_S109]|uniref:Urease accessory protein UreF n=1 Tax=Microcystis wesenbergii Mw_MB_S_20031200_S109D TaxID=2486241 RepID=A0A552M6T4_9CHRO|nr:MAG: urease accessory protein UreF [Microcystis wesenbergii Mw_MB_S_20031200_S109]TRV28166.1 MAG: urease accessory protein UreF [Microcystis wesenbergii Mw_MB_S_20031200_S109D]
MLDQKELLCLLQLASPILPVGAYSYSEGLETLVENGIISNSASLNDWLERSLCQGSIRLETAVLVRVYRCFCQGDFTKLNYWDNWLSATRETAELRQQSWQMGRSLLNLLRELAADRDNLPEQANYATAFAIGASHGQIGEELAVLGYLHSWASNLINAGLRLIPLGQTLGQALLIGLQPSLLTATADIISLADENLSSWSWGLSFASMNHETQYSRLFRS